MFQKLLSNLPFNPSLISKVSFYTNRLKKETFVRRLGVFFIIAALGIQVFAMVAPAEPSLAASSNDIKYGGFSSKDQVVNHCLGNGEFSTILRHFGVSCAALSAGSVRSVNSRDYGGQLFSIGRLAYGKAGETAVDVPGAGRYYMRYLWSWDAPGTTSTYTTLTGTRSDGTTFMILFNCGNITIVGTPPTAPPPKTVACANLIINVTPGSRVPAGSVIGVRGQATGQNLPPGELVDMYYDFIDASTNVPIANAQARGVPFAGAGGSSATDTQDRTFTLTGPGHFIFRLAVTYNNNGAKADAAGNMTGSCIRDVYVDTPPPTPQKVIECTTLIPSFSNGQRIVTGTTVTVRGQAGGRNLPAGELADMYYDYIDSSGKVLGSQKALGVPFKDGSAQDSVPRSFKLEKPGTYKFRLAVKYDGSTKTAAGSQAGNCIKEVVVQPPCEQSKENDETECIILNKRATNLTQNIPDANNTEAKPGDLILYTLSAKNTSKTTTVKNFIFEENITDILEYADVTDLHGGTKDANNIVRWPAVDVKAGQTVEKQITVRIKSPLPQTPRSVSNPGSFDMLMTNVYGTTVQIKLPPSVTKTTEQVTTSLPNTGPGETLAVGVTLTVVVSYFFARSRLMVEELELVRSDYSVSGGL